MLACSQPTLPVGTCTLLVLASSAQPASPNASRCEKENRTRQGHKKRAVPLPRCGRGFSRYVRKEGSSSLPTILRILCIHYFSVSVDGLLLLEGCWYYNDYLSVRNSIVYCIRKRKKAKKEKQKSARRHRG